MRLNLSVVLTVPFLVASLVAVCSPIFSEDINDKSRKGETGKALTMEEANEAWRRKYLSPINVIVSGQKQDVESFAREMQKVNIYDAYERKGREYMDARQYEAALLIYQEGKNALGGAPFKREFAEVYEALGDYSKAIEYVGILLSNWPSDFTRPDAEHWKEALEAADRGEFDQAVQIYGTLLVKAENWERPEIQQRLGLMEERARKAGQLETGTNSIVPGSRGKAIR